VLQPCATYRLRGGQKANTLRTALPCGLGQKKQVGGGYVKKHESVRTLNGNGAKPARLLHAQRNVFPHSTIPTPKFEVQNNTPQDPSPDEMVPLWRAFVRRRRVPLSTPGGWVTTKPGVKPPYTHAGPDTA
jgi:hypothetical protein